MKIGYPDKWRDYSTLKIDRGPYVLNAARAANFETDRELKKIGKPVDRNEWGMTPPTVNAYYNPNMNEIVFPAGILQPPFFNAKADDAINYGGIGAVIAHEISHGFDDQGRQYDAQGNLRDWWTPESAAKYKERADKIVKQYSEYEPLPGMHINGELTQGENIADDGGVKLAFAALKKRWRKTRKPQRKRSTASRRSSVSSSAGPRSGGRTFATKRSSCGSTPTRTRRPNTAAMVRSRIRRISRRRSICRTIARWCGRPTRS